MNFNLPISDQLDEILSEAIDSEKLVERNDDERQARILYDPNTDSPYTGWVKVNGPDDDLKILAETKAGMKDGLFFEFKESGGISMVSFKDNRQGFGPHAYFYANGQKSSEGSKTDRKAVGIWNRWYENGQKGMEVNFKGGLSMSAVSWKPNGDKCPVTNLKNGNGILVWYRDDGTESSRTTYKDGERVRN